MRSLNWLNWLLLTKNNVSKTHVIMFFFRSSLGIDPLNLDAFLNRGCWVFVAPTWHSQRKRRQSKSVKMYHSETEWHIVFLELFLIPLFHNNYSCWTVEKVCRSVFYRNQTFDQQMTKYYAAMTSIQSLSCLKLLNIINQTLWNNL